MLNKLKETLKDKYSKKSLNTLEKIEAILVFEEFDSDIALKVGTLLVERSKKYGEISITIIREKDEQCIFQYVGNDKSQRNIDFAKRKRNTVLKTNHCSLWAMVKEVVDGGLDDIFDAQSNCLPVGGSFPILVNDNLVATISVSGLKNGADHSLIIDGLSEYLEKKVPIFTDPTI